MNIVLNADGLIVMTSDSGMPTPPEGGVVITLSAEQLVAYEAALQLPNSGIFFIDGVFTPRPPLAAAVFPDPSTDGLIERRARAAERSGDELTAIKLRTGVQ